MLYILTYFFYYTIHNKTILYVLRLHSRNKSCAGFRREAAGRHKDTTGIDPLDGAVDKPLRTGHTFLPRPGLCLIDSITAYAKSLL